MYKLIVEYLRNSLDKNLASYIGNAPINQGSFHLFKLINAISFNRFFRWSRTIKGNYTNRFSRGLIIN